MPREKITSTTCKRNRFNFTAIVSTTHADYFCDFVAQLTEAEILAHFKTHRVKWKPAHLRPELDRWLEAAA